MTLLGERQQSLSNYRTRTQCNGTRTRGLCVQTGSSLARLSILA